MKGKRLVLILTTLLLIMGVINAEAALPSAEAADWPWTVKAFDEDEDSVMNLSTTFVGAHEIPMFSYTKDDGKHRIYQAFLAPSKDLAICGPNNAWYCTYWWDKDLVPGTVSNVATLRYGSDTFGIKWAFKAGGKIRGATAELMNDLTLVTNTWEDLIDLGKFGGILVGAPSLQNKGGKFRLALTVRDNTDFYGHNLVYMYYSGVNNNSCLSSGSKYQCDVIEIAYGMGSIGAPSLQVSPDGKVGIAYYFVRDLKYAYPFPESIPLQMRYPNCGPGGDTWRCITIFDAVTPNTVGTKVKQAVGLTDADRGIAFTYHASLTNALKLAKYVGSGGNCGEDGKVFTNPILRWQCSDVDNIANHPSGTFSIAIDPEGFPVIAYDNTDDDMAPTSLHLSYPKARIGDSDPGWTRQTIDPAPHIDVNVGGQAALALNSDGLGFIAYRVDDGYNLTTPLKYALQQQTFSIFMPLIQR